MELFKNVASQKIRVFAFATSAHASLNPGEPVTGDAANITAQTAADNAALGASNDANPDEVDATNAPGVYEFDPTQAETNGDVIEWYPVSSTTGVEVVTVGGSSISTRPANWPDLGIESDGDLTKVNTLDGHTAQTGDSFARLGSPAGASIAADIAENQTDLDAILTDLTDGTVVVGTNNDKTEYSIIATGASSGKAADDLVDDVMDEVITGAQHNVNNSLAKFIREVSEAVAMTRGTAQGSTSNTLQLASGDVTSDDLLNHQAVSIIEGTGQGQARTITDSVASTDTITVDRAWDVNPDATSVYAIGSAVAVLGRIAHTGATVPTVTDVTNAVTILETTDSGNSIITDATTFAEPASVPTWPITLAEGLGWLTALGRNKRTTTSSADTVRNDADNADIGSATLADDGSEFSRSEYT